MSNMTNSWVCCLLTIVIAILITISSTNADINCEDAQRIKGPIITPCQKEIILEKGQNFTLTCKGTRELTFRHQESPEEITGPFTVINKIDRISEGDYIYEHTLELYYINQFAIGYYGCYDNTFQDGLLEKLTEEPNNTAHASFIYIYVSGTDSLFAPMREVILPRCESKVAIECRPTTPDIEVTLVSDFADLLFQQFSPKSGFVIDSASVGLDVPVGIYTCLFNDRKLEKKSERFVFVNKRIAPPPPPTVSPKYKKYLSGESFTINCTVPYKSNSLIDLLWNYPPTISDVNVSHITNRNNVKDGSSLYHSITVVNATRDHAGVYTCQSSNNCERKDSTSNAVFLEKAYLNLKLGNHLHDGQSYLETKQKTIKITVEMDAYPTPDFYFLRDFQPLDKSSKYKVERTGTGDAKLTITDLNINDTANYTLVADNRYLKKNLTIDVRKFAQPTILFDKSIKRVAENALVSLKCEVFGYPLPNVIWTFQNDGLEQVLPSTSTKRNSVYNLVAFLDIPQIHTSGEITCSAINNQGKGNSSSRKLLVYEIDDGFGIMNKETTQFYQSQDVTISCYASKYDFYNVTWLLKDEEANVTNVLIEYSNSSFSHIAKLRIPHITTNQGGIYICHGVRLDEVEEKDDINISVEELVAPKIESVADLSLEVYPYQPVQLNCQVEGVPTPDVQWYKDKEILKNDSNIKIFTDTYWTAVNSTVMIDNTVDEKYRGSYECVAESISGRTSQLYTIASKAGQKLTTMLSAIIVIIFALILLVLYLTCRIRKEKKFRRELQAAGLLYFKEGVTKSLNPELGIDEQAELLPYDERFEFPPEKLILGKQLGAGAFGVVYKAEARGIINAEETTEVAVKMVKKNADNMYIKALASELKIMVHLGKHINIVNLLGACTKNVGKRELLVIVEYCKFGNIHNYMQKHREVFIDQLTNNVEKNVGRVNRGFSCSGGSTGVHSDYFGSSTQNTDNTFINSENTNRSTRKGKPKQTLELVRVSEGYVQPEWRSNYESDYSFDGRNPRPLTSRDLLVWAFQIARGMEYLASRKVLHGDLAARNILLAEDNIVKICDFGLARSIYKNDEYQKKENGLLPVKWLAIECMTDRIFSTQSDVWAFGIVLWELFSLAKTPYPNITPASLIQWLSEGNRLHKPAYADERLHNLMMRCWHQKPTLRPTFTELQEILGGFLEDNVRNHYVDLNSAYMELNDKPVGQEDYLTMMCAPDYNNLVTPSPHHYINGAQSFFPATTAPVDEQGYLQMSPASRQNIFSPRTPDTQFDFEAHKFIPKMSEASNCGSELTPMLTLNNLPARSGSDSDHEGNTSPYLHMCPRIDEETDEVFEVKQNNAKNAQNTAITNPTYITLEVDIEKPKDINNSYINVPNGLVK